MSRKGQVRLKDIAQEANVSVATVSRYLSGTLIRQESAKSIEKVLRKKDWAGYSTAHLRQTKDIDTKTIGLIVPDIEHNYFATIAAGAMEVARSHGYMIVVASASRSRTDERQLLGQMSHLHLEGLLYVPVASWEGANPPELDLFKDIPTVVVARRNVLPGKPHVYTDNITGGYVATRYMLSLGRKNIGFIIGVWEFPFGGMDIVELVKDPATLGGFASLDRFRGYLKALAEFKIPYDPLLVAIAPWSFEGGKMAAAELIGKAPAIDGIIATSDTMASGVLDTYKTHGFSVPRDISVMSWDNSELARFTDPQLTSVEQPSRRMGESSMDVLNRMIRHENVQDIVFDVTIVPRGSTSIRK